MQIAIAGAACGRPEFDAIKSIQHHPSSILTGADFAPPPRKSWLEKLFDQLIKMLNQEGKP